MRERGTLKGLGGFLKDLEMNTKNNRELWRGLKCLGDVTGLLVGKIWLQSEGWTKRRQGLLEEDQMLVFKWPALSSRNKKLNLLFANKGRTLFMGHSLNRPNMALGEVRVQGLVDLAIGKQVPGWLFLTG